MDYEDIRRARAHHAELSRIFSRTLSPDDAHLGPQVLRECWGAWTAVDNNQCRSRIRKIVECASQLFAPRPRGVPVILREQ